MVILPLGTMLGPDLRVVRQLAPDDSLVFVVEQLSIAKEHALRTYLPASKPVRERVETLARSLARVASDHVAHVLGCGFVEDRYVAWLLTELVDGETFEAHSDRTGPMPLETVRDLFAQLGHGLSRAHTIDLVHGTLTPRDVFLTRPRSPGAAFTVKVTGFGDRFVLPMEERGAVAVGAPWWTPPELMGAKDRLTPATDVWGLGLMAFLALTGKRYWRSANTPEPSMMSLLREAFFEPMPAATVRAEELGSSARMPPKFDAWFARCLEREPTARFADAGAATEALLASL